MRRKELNYPVKLENIPFVFPHFLICEVEVILGPIA